jgi:MFS transporter, DHA1 family, quinolone resistance protein
MTRSENAYGGDPKRARRELGRVRRVYYLITGLYWIATALPMPIIVLLQRERGMDLFQVGVLTAVYSVTIIALEVPTGGLADAWGRRRVSVLAYLVMAASMLSLAMAGGFILLAATFVLYGAGRALISGALEAWFVDEVLRLAPEEELQRSLAYGNTVSLFALSAASLLGGWLPELLSGTELPGGRSALALPPAAAAGVLLITGVLTARLVREQVAAAPADASGRADAVDATEADGAGEAGSIILRAILDTVRNRTLLLLAMLSVVAGAAISTMETFWQPFFADTLDGGTPTRLFGVITAGNFLLAMGGNLASTPLTRLLGGRPARFAAVAQGLRGVFVLLLALQYSMGPAVGAFWLAYMMVGAGESPHQTLINRNVAPQRRSAMLSVQSLALSLGAFMGSAVFGYIARAVGLRAVWIVTAGYLVLSLVLYLRVDARESRSERVQYVPAEANAGTASS